MHQVHVLDVSSTTYNSQINKALNMCLDREAFEIAPWAALQKLTSSFYLGLPEKR